MRLTDELGGVSHPPVCEGFWVPLWIVSDLPTCEGFGFPMYISCFFSLRNNSFHLLCLGHNFLTDAIFSIPLSKVIYIFRVLRMDIYIDHIYGHINPYKNGHYGHFVEIGHFGLM